MLPVSSRHSACVFLFQSEGQRVERGRCKERRRKRRVKEKERERAVSSQTPLAECHGGAASRPTRSIICLKETR